VAKVKDEFRNLTGAQKAAIFMLSLNREHSAKLFEMMDDEEIRDMSQTMSTLGSVSSIHRRAPVR